MDYKIKDRLQSLFNAFSWFCAILLIFGCGFYLGHRIAENQVAVRSKIESSSSLETSKATSLEIKKVDGIYFFKLNAADHNCPSEYKIKGTFNPDGGNYYIESNKNYGRIKPDICFATEEVARDTAGFIKKY